MSSSSATPLPPAAIIANLASGAWQMRSLAAVAKLGIADLLARGPRPVAELAAETKTHADSLYRVLRFLSSLGVFHEHAGRRFSLTPAGDLMRSDVPGSMRALALMSSSAWELSSWARLDHSLATGKPAFDEVHGMDIWSFFKSHPEDAANFNAAMTSYSANEHAAAVEAFDFSAFKRIADIGGGLGRLIGLILQKNASLRGVLFDLPHVVAGAPDQLRSLGVADRCDIVGGNFFESVPAACDAYVMGHIIHDWDDEHAIRILKTIRHAAAPASRVLLIEAIVQGPNQPDGAKLLDLQMLVVPGGRERTVDEYAALFAAAGWKLKGTTVTRSGKNVIEAVTG